MPDPIKLTIDGKEAAAPKGMNLIEAAKLVGVEVPHYCYHPKLTIVGNCRCAGRCCDEIHAQNQVTENRNLHGA